MTRNNDAQESFPRQGLGFLGRNLTGSIYAPMSLVSKHFKYTMHFAVFTIKHARTPLRTTHYAPTHAMEKTARDGCFSSSQITRRRDLTHHQKGCSMSTHRSSERRVL